MNTPCTTHLGGAERAERFEVALALGHLLVVDVHKSVVDPVLAEVLAYRSARVTCDQRESRVIY